VPKENPCGERTRLSDTCLSYWIGRPRYNNFGVSAREA
jgi:hypothetical protein